VVLGGAAAVLAAGITQVAAIGVRVREVPRDGVVDRRLDELAEARDEPVDEREHDRETHRPPRVAEAHGCGKRTGPDMALPGLGPVGGCSLLLFATLIVQVRLVEEPHLASVFGPDYAAYARRTGRFVPGVGLLR
jgi:hypothetical protein